MCKFIVIKGKNEGQVCKRKTNIGDEYCERHKKIVKKNIEKSLCEEPGKKSDEDVKKYYNESLCKRLYDKTIEVLNKNYEKPCLNFTGSIDNDGYGRTSIYGKHERAHRASYALFNNIFVEDIPIENETGGRLVISHGNGCQRTCIEPTHLLLKTQAENLYEDKIRDGTLLRGEKNPISKITEDTARLVKGSKGEVSQKERAVKFNVSKYIIRDIDNGRNWSHIPDKEGKIVSTEDIRKKYRDRSVQNKKLEFSDDDLHEISKKLKNNIIESDYIHSKVETKCHLFTGYLNKGGYGTIGYKSVVYLAHVLSYYLKIEKKIGNDGQEVVRHLCDTPRCCNPDHLILGTRRDNALDNLTYSKGVKLNDDQVKEIKT